MNLLTLSLANLRSNWLTTWLNLSLLALGMGTIVLLLLLSQSLEEKLSRDSHGIDLVIGAKGSPLQLILSNIYHADVPTGNIPLSEAQKWMSHPLVKTAIPLALGDNYLGYRIVGTTAAYPLHYGALLAQGRLWNKGLEATLGAAVAQQTGLEVGALLTGAHGLVAGGHQHSDDKYVVTGILKPTGTVIDRLILTGIESVWEIHKEGGGKHDERSQEEEHSEREHSHEAFSHEEIDHFSQREITALLIQYQSPLAAVSLPRLINSKTTLQAASPAYEIARLLKLIGFGIGTLRAIGVLFIIMATLSMFIALYQALEKRRYDLAIMRTLGASKVRLMWQLWFEGLLLATLGTLLGLGLGHVVTEVIGWWLNPVQQLHLTGWTYVKPELGLLVLAVVIGSVAALLPAIQAYRTDIARTLSSG